VHAAVIPMDTPRVLRDQTVVVSRGEIVAIGPAAAMKIPAGALRVDATGRYLTSPASFPGSPCTANSRSWSKRGSRPTRRFARRQPAPSNTWARPTGPARSRSASVRI
jgi:cytosine/adenosine deaminase-related metal-dependent hydrolase